jgi:formylglycine-generating enzyme required for sulfatase activity
MGGEAFGPAGFRVDAQEPIHRVTISKPFYMCVYPITVEQWQAVMGRESADGADSAGAMVDDPKCPVTMVSWLDCQEFIRRLETLGLRGFRLPTEAEWEYACRAGTATKFYWGDDAELAREYTWCYENSDGHTHPVGLKKPNAWGLYDMNGNVWEWCADWFAGYSAGAEVDPVGPAEGSERVVRGASYGDGAVCMLSALRNKRAPSDRYRYYGFRLVRDAP